MEFRIADTFTDSLARLTGDEQKAVKTTSFDLQINPESPGMSFHKLDRARDKNFWSVRVNVDVRMIVHKSDGSLMLCYVDHHDKAYDWAAKRKLETHPTTGAAQLVEIRETVQEILIPTYTQTRLGLPASAGMSASAANLAPSPLAGRVGVGSYPPLFTQFTDADLLGYGVPVEWLSDVKNATEDNVLTLAEHLPAEAAEALLELATGGKPRVMEPLELTINPFDHPDAQRRFRVVADAEELQRALDFPWDKWTIFLHPEQRQWVEREQSGPARVSGSAGTGKTVVALHRAAFLARANPESRVLLTTFSDILANDLLARMKRLVYHEPKLAERIDVYSVNAIGARLYKGHFGAPNLATGETIQELVAAASAQVPGQKFNLPFLMAEWEEIVDAWQLESWDAYRTVARLGRKTRLPEAQRAILWSIYEIVRAGLAERSLITHSQMFTRLAAATATAKHPPFDFAIIDEAQDLTIQQLRFFAALGAVRSDSASEWDNAAGRGRSGGRSPDASALPVPTPPKDSLFFAGDLGQRIFQTPFSWLSLGVDIRGRSRTLRINYRTSHQIRAQADRLLGLQVADVDGNVEERGDTISVFNGPPPAVVVFDSPDKEAAGVASWIKDYLNSGLEPHEFGVFVRSSDELDRARAAVAAAGVPSKALDESNGSAPGHVSICTMHAAKGLEFRAVVVMACDDEVIPLQSRIESVGDESDLREVYETERHLLYVACTRARDYLLVTGVAPASEFLDDLRG